MRDSERPFPSALAPPEQILYDMPVNFREFWNAARAPHRRWMWWGTGFLLFFLLLAAPLPLEASAHRALAVFVLAAYLWATHAFPLPVTGLVVLFLLPTTGALSHTETYAHFASPAVMFVLGALILASPVMRSGLSSRVALLTVSRFARSPRRLVFVIFSLATLFSLFINEHAVAAMMFPIVFEFAYSARETDPRLPPRLFLAMAWGCIVGGTGTLLGGARAPLAMGFLQATTGETLGFVEWSLAAFPAVLVLYITGLMFLLRGLPETLPEALQEDLTRKVDALGKFTAREARTAGILFLTVLLWTVAGDRWGLDSIALLGVVLSFALRVISWREIEEDVNWGIIIMYGSAMALGASLEITGLTGVLASALLERLHLLPGLFLLGLAFLSLVLTEAVSNVATVAILMPLGLALAQPLGVPGKTVALAVAYPAGLAFLLPISTPALAIATGGNLLFPRQILLSGIAMKLVSFLVVGLLAYLWWPSVLGGG